MTDYKAVADSLRACTDPQKHHAADVIDELVRLADADGQRLASMLDRARVAEEKLALLESAPSDGASIPADPYRAQMWRVAPVEATRAMIDAVRNNDVDLVRDGFEGGMAKLWRAMLAAAPQPSPARFCSETTKGD